MLWEMEFFRKTLTLNIASEEDVMEKWSFFRKTLNCKNNYYEYKNEI
jgi:hypothetical protein